MEAHHLSAWCAQHSAGNGVEVAAAAQPVCDREQRFFPFPEGDQIEWGAELEEPLGFERRFHSAGDEHRGGDRAARLMRKRQVVPQRHAGRRDADQIPRSRAQLGFERLLDMGAAAIGIEDLCLDAVRLQRSCETPYSQGRGEKRVLTAVWIPRTHQQVCQITPTFPVVHTHSIQAGEPARACS